MKFDSKFWFSELSGCLGDLGTFLPLIIGLVKAIKLDLGSSLIATGIYNILSGYSFGTPMPVQPMKTIAAVAIDKKLSVDEVCMAGIFVSGVVFFLGVTRWIQVFNLLIPSEVIRGIQLQVGYKLALSGVAMAFCIGGTFNSKRSLAQNVLPFWSVEGLAVSISVLAMFLLTLNWTFRSGCCGVLQAKDVPSALPDAPALPLYSTSQPHEGPLQVDEGEQGHPSHGNPLGRPPLSSGSSDASFKPLGPEPTSPDNERKDKDARKEQPLTLSKAVGARLGALWAWLSRANIPSALVAVILGVILACASHSGALGHVHLGPSTPKVIDYHSLSKWQTGIQQMGLGQLPLTALNSVVAVVAISTELFPDVPVTCAKVATSVGMMNLVGCWFGCLPCCHGSGGLAAQARFGATTGAAPMILGGIKIFLGLVFGSSLFQILQHFPNTVLGPMLIISGLELAGTIQFETSKVGTFVMLWTAAIGQTLDDTAVGFAAGLCASYLIKLRLEGWRPLYYRLLEVGREIKRDYKATYERAKERSARLLHRHA